MVLDALEMACWSRGTQLTGLRCHSDAGSQFTCVRDGERLAELGAAPSIGTAATASTTRSPRLDNAIYDQPAVSPDGSRLAFVSTRTSSDGTRCEYAVETDVAVMDLETGRQQVWASSDERTSNALSWAPDSRTIAFLWGRSSAEPPPPYSGQLRVLDVTRPGRLEDSRAVTRGEVVTVPGVGTGHLFDLTVTADGTHAWAVFGMPVKVEQDTEDATYSKEDHARALVKISLEDGAVTVVDDTIAAKLVAHLAADASREHLLVYGNSGGFPMSRTTTRPRRSAGTTTVRSPGSTARKRRRTWPGDTADSGRPARRLRAGRSAFAWTFGVRLALWPGLSGGWR